MRASPKSLNRRYRATQRNLPPGHSDIHATVLSMKLVCYHVRHRMRIYRTSVIVDITLDAVYALLNLKNEEKSQPGHMVLPQVTGNDWPKSIGVNQGVSGGHSGVTDCPLDYVIQEEYDKKI